MIIGARHIAHGLVPYVIAEIGVNHDGSVERALALTDAAVGAGADAIKLQLFKAELLMSSVSRLAAYQEDAGETDPFTMLRRLELAPQEMRAVVQHAHARGIHAIVSVFSLELVQAGERVGVDAFKTASPDIINRPLIELLLATGKPLILSTGAANEAEVLRAAGWVGLSADRASFLHCVSSYPTPPDKAALAGISALRDLVPLPVGYSDHTTMEETGGLAAAAGACILEKHLTYDRAAAGPDHAASLEPEQFARYVQQARRGAAMLGRAGKRVLDIEGDVRKVSRQSLVTARPLPAGYRITRDDLTVKRPGTGLEPWKLSEIIGRETSRPVKADVPLTEGDLER